MADWLVALFFGLGVGGFTYAKMSRRVGYGNSTSAWISAAVAFIICFVFFYTLMAWVLGIH